jgi:hypothetical protein
VNRVETEIKLARDRAWVLETWGAIDPERLVEPCTVSLADPDFWWTAKDHFAHLISVERIFTGRFVTNYVDGAKDSVGSVLGDVPKELADASMLAAQVNDRWVKKYHDASFDELVIKGEQERQRTYELLARIPDDKFEDQIPGALWDGGSVGSMLCVAYGRHGRQHWDWVQEGWRERGLQ